MKYNFKLKTGEVTPCEGEFPWKNEAIVITSHINSQSELAIFKVHYPNWKKFIGLKPVLKEI
tara:strand:+ start:3464 stop:3649 length:186 start_codon:yes stop_codon:yes gene_type:complete